MQTATITKYLKICFENFNLFNNSFNRQRGRKISVRITDNRKRDLKLRNQTDLIDFALVLVYNTDKYGKSEEKLWAYSVLAEKRKKRIIS